MLHLVHLPTLQAPITDAMLEGAPCVLSFGMTETRNEVAKAELVLKNPGLSILNASPYVAVVETPRGGPETVAAGKVLLRARISGVPSDLKGHEITLLLTCAPASHQQDLIAAANTAVGGAAIPPWTVRVIPQPDPGIVAVAFTGAPGSSTSWDLAKARAIKVSSFFQQDLIRTPYSRISWNVLNVANARLTLSLPASAREAAYAAARSGAFALIGLSGDNDPTHATFFTYGVVMGAGPGPFGLVDVQVNLADSRLTDSGFAYGTGDPTASGLPLFDPLFGGSADDAPTTVLEARAEAWHVDPVTHAITLDPILTGPVTDLGGLGDDFSTEVAAGASPVKHVKMRIVVEWEQHAKGRLDVSPLIGLAAGPSGYVTSVQDRVIEPSTDPALDFRDWGFWNKGTWRWTSYSSPSTSFSTGRTIEVTYRVDTDGMILRDANGNFIYDANGNIQVTPSTQGEAFTYQHIEYASVNVRHVRYTSAFVSYEYSQPRKESVDLVLDCEAQGTYGATDTAVLPTVTLGDILNAAGVQPFQEGTIYNQGDRVIAYGSVWQCLRNGTATFYSLVTKGAGKDGTARFAGLRVTYEPIYWQDLGTYAPLRDFRSPSFFDTDRGQGCIRHALARMRATALRRLEMVTVSRTYPWELARDITLKDRVRVLIRDGDKATPFVGKVKGIERRITEGGPATVRLTLAVPLGTGRDESVDDKAGGAYGGDDYFGTDYTPVPTAQYLVPSVSGGGFGVLGVCGDVEAVSTPDNLFMPVDAFKLNDPNYAVREVYIDNQADKQIAAMRARLASGRDPRAVTRDMPTLIRMGMRYLRTYPTLERQYSVHGVLTWSPRGVDIVTGGEP